MVATVGHDIAACLNGSRTVLVPGADHMLPLHTPAKLAEIVTGAARSL